jgi:hypothetical protein
VILEQQAETLVKEGLAPVWERPVFEHLNLDQAAHIIAEAMCQFDAYVSNIQGACDQGTFQVMLDRANALYEEASEG